VPVFITTDMSSDDVVAILYLLRHPGVEVLGIGSANGVAHVEAAATNVLRLLALVQREDIPVAVGSASALEGDHNFPNSWRGGADRLFGLTVPVAKTQPVSQSCAELLAATVKGHPAAVTLVLLGAHTDLALALRQDPALAQQIKAVHMMGGAVHVPGNIHAEYPAEDNEAAEWNLWLDYRAAAEVFSSGIPLSVVPLDATNGVRVDQAYYQRLRDSAMSPAAKAIAELWKQQARTSGGFYIWDAVAAVALTAPQAARWEGALLSIVTGDPKTLGQTVAVSGMKANSKVCLSVDLPTLQEDLLSVLNR
jgi:inosine-uridine nucleoside N-ribohydrolase